MPAAIATSAARVHAARSTLRLLGSVVLAIIDRGLGRTVVSTQPYPFGDTTSIGSSPVFMWQCTDRIGTKIQSPASMSNRSPSISNQPLPLTM